VSCSSAGNCSAGGCSADCQQALVVSEVGGAWQPAEEVPGIAALNQGGGAEVDSVSCASAGNCSAAGRYTDISRHTQLFVVSQVGGVWQRAGEVPGTAELNHGGGAGIFSDGIEIGSGGTAIGSVSCASAGNCSAGGYYTDRSGTQQVFVVSQVGGVWRQAEEVPGTAALNLGASKVPSDQRFIQQSDASLYSVSCASAGNCSAGGYYIDGSGDQQAFVVSEVGGVWQRAEEVPGTAANNRGPVPDIGFNGTEVNAVSCTSAGNCVAGGTDLVAGGANVDGLSFLEAFVVREVGGIWQPAEVAPGTVPLDYGGGAIKSVSCTSAGNCSAGGYYTDGGKDQQAFVISEVGGVWRQAEEVPGTAALNTFTHSAYPSTSTLGAEVTSVSCASPGNCSAGGFYSTGPNEQQAFVVTQTRGTWQVAKEVPGTAALNKGHHAEINSVSCPPAGSCSAGGDYEDGSSAEHAFVTGLD
jgi:hypothetical protein